MRSVLMGVQVRYLILIITVVMLSACNKYLRFNELGTDTGNPYLGTDTGNPSGPNHNVNESQPETPELITESIEFRNNIEAVICNKLNKCNPSINETTCLAKVKQVSGIPAILGFSKLTYTNLNKVYADKRFSSADYNKTNLINCLNEIITMKCTDTQVLDAWSTTAPLRFANVTRLLKNSANCTTIGK